MSIDQVLTDLAEWLRWPVLAASLAALALAALEVGRFAVELVRAGGARRRRARADALLASARAGALTPLARDALPGGAATATAEALFAHRGDRAAAEEALAQFELSAQRRLEPSRLLVRAGPALGLMGTLIPLVPGLAALGEGEITGLATELRTAFAATILGLAVGLIGFALTLVRNRLYAEQLHLLERVAAQLEESACAA